MSTRAYLFLKGQRQGNLTAGVSTVESVGNAYQSNDGDRILVQGFSHQIIVPRDIQSGLPSGPRVHKPLMISKIVDKSTPLIMSALTSGEMLEEFRITWYRTSATSGSEEAYFSVDLAEAVIVDVQTRNDPNTAIFSHFEDVYFAYKKITWTHDVCGTSGTDDLRSPLLT